MDQERAIRYVTPPAMFFGSLLIGGWFADPAKFQQLAKDDFLHLATAIGASLFPLGFLLTGFSTLLLGILFSRSQHSYEIALSEGAWDRIWHLLEFEIETEKSIINKQVAAQTFAHEFLPDQTHAGLARLWSAFNVAAHSLTATIISLPVGYCVFGIACTPQWILSIAVVVSVLLWVAKRTWQRHMAFLELQARRAWPRGKNATKLVGTKS